MLKQTSLFDTKKVDSTVIETYLFFAIELSKEQYSRTELSLITREVNRLFPMPAMILFKHGNTLTLSVINRRLHKKDESKDVLEKVTQIKDINIVNPHRAHIEILFDLSFDELKGKHQFTNFVELHNAWQKTLDTKELNKRFYEELFKWYLWAVKNVEFPQIRPKEDLIPDEAHQSESVIRLLTRLLFCWFMKEKQQLIPETLFDEKEAKRILKNFNFDKKKSSVYYRAVLQNLFFATLSVPIKDRKYLRESFKGKSSDHGNQYVFRYQDEFANSKENLKLFKDIPFLNGGLFDSLDKRKDEDNPIEIRLDGFSSNEKKQAFVPDFIFWGEHKGIDLSKELDNSRKNNETVNGIFEILNDYKFTIEEKTPIEEEVALDPDLLGRTFENLLASYNPETKTNARKQTGSFYTPREIVDYMVDESLLGYLKENVKVKDEADKKFRELISYSENKIRFSEEEKTKLLTAIENLKVIDPACGSGAFPMGILQKLVWLLHKIDPDNKKWFESLINRLPEYTQAEMRKKLDGENWNYIRKLGLIQQSIYGVDRQPIAIQIAKLRFFISLIVDQKVRDTPENNFGLLPLPNLDFKLVCANTLIKAPEEYQGGSIQFTDEFADKFTVATGKFFSVYLPKEKKKVVSEIKTLVNEKVEEKLGEIKSLYRSNDAKTKAALKQINRGQIERKEKDIKLWESYNNLFKYETVAFFETKYFFPEVKNGFGIAIGNPPYVRADNPDISYLRKQIMDSKQYKTLWEKWDLYVAFIEKTFELLSVNGKLSFIIPDAYMASKYSEKSHDYFLKNATIDRINFCSEVKIFDAAVKNIIIQFSKKVNPQNIPLRIKHVDDFENATVLDSISQVDAGEKTFKLNQNSLFLDNITDTTAWEEICYVSKGMVLQSDENNYRGEFTKEDLISNVKDRIHPKKYLEAKWIKRFEIESIKYLEWNTERVPERISRPTFPELYQPEKIIMGGMTGAIYDNKGFLCNHSCSVSVLWKDLSGVNNLSINNSVRKDFKVKGDKKALVKFKKSLEATSENYSMKYLLAILNSKFGYYFLDTKRRSQMGFYPDDLKQLPIKNTTKKIQSQFQNLVDIISTLKANKKDSVFFERLLNAMVYEIYFPEAILQTKCEVMKHLNNLQELREGDDENNLKAIEKNYKELSGENHALTDAIFKMDTVEAIAIIEGKK